MLENAKKRRQAQQQKGTQTPDTHLQQKIHTDTHAPKHNSLVQTVLLQDFYHNKTQH